MRRGTIGRGGFRDQVNFLLTNLPPRRRLTTVFGRFSRIENPLVAGAAIALWRRTSPLDLSDAADARFASLHACFTRRLRPGARPADPDPSVLASPCDAIVGAAGPVGDGTVLQVKGSPYALADLLGDAAHAALFRGGAYVTLRLTASMYHRFHAPHDMRVRSVTHVPGDCRNVNPPALARVPRLYCRNERAVVRASLDATGEPLTLVPVAAILVAGIRLGFLDLAHRKTPTTHACDASLRKGDEMGWFEHGSTIVMCAPAGFVPAPEVRSGETIRAGAPLMRRIAGPPPHPATPVPDA